MVAWPTDLTITRNNYKESPPDNTIRSGMDTGPDKIRRRTTANIRPISIAMKLTDEQVDTLDDFYVNVTYSGSLPFDFVHPRTGATVQARFSQPPEWSVDQTMYDAMAQLEILP